MGKAYGTPIPQTTDGPQLDVAQGQVEGTYPAPWLAEWTLWRIEAVQYSQCVDPDAERYEATPPRLELFAITVLRYTTHGATLHEYSGMRRRWTDLRPGHKQYASRTPADALEQFRCRRRAQIRILQAQLARAERELALTEPLPVFPAPPVWPGTCSQCGTPLMMAGAVCPNIDCVPSP